MSQEKKPDPIEDVREGLGLLFRAAKNAVRELPTDKLEESLKTGVREVSRAVENVAGAIEREVFGAKKNEGASPTEGEAPPSPDARVRVDADVEKPTPGAPASPPAAVPPATDKPDEPTGH